jgi:hypothetical protein
MQSKFSTEAEPHQNEAISAGAKREAGKEERCGQRGRGAVGPLVADTLCLATFFNIVRDVAANSSPNYLAIRSSSNLS